MASVELAQIPTGLVDHYWPGVFAWLKASHDRMGGDPVSQMYHRIASEEARLWCVFVDQINCAAAVDSIRGTTAYIEALGGHRMREWVRPAWAEYVQLARNNGMDNIEIEGRRWDFLPGVSIRRYITGRSL